MADLPDLEPVRASWQRSAERYRIAQGSQQAPWILTAQELSASRAPVDELIGIAAHENDRLFAAVGKVGYALLFTAADGVVVDVRGEPARVQQFQHWGIWQGGVWAESVEGTNGIGTCIAEKAPVTVHRSHHFRARHATLSCCGAPVFDPNQNLVAVLDVSSYEPQLSEHSHALAFALTVEAARSIEERLFRHVHRRAWILSAIAPTRSQPILLAVENDERVIGADRQARSALDIDEQQLAAGLSLWRFFDRSASLFASNSGDGFVKLTRLGESAPWHVVFTPPLPPRAAPLDLRPRVRRSRDIPAAGGDPATTLGMFGASIAHELNQPLGAIVASAGASSRWLSAQPPNLARAQRALERIANEGRRASEIIEGLRVLVKRQAPRRVRFNLNEAVLEVLRQTHDEVQRNAISLQTSLAGDLPLVECARTQIEQVILNLVVNAIQAMRAAAERPRRLAVGSSREGPNAVRVEVRDSGPGVDPSQADRLFEAFYTTKAEGIGMGLSISRAIIEVHGGRLWVGPNEPSGAAFCFSLPIEAAGA